MEMDDSNSRVLLLLSTPYIKRAAAKSHNDSNGASSMRVVDITRNTGVEAIIREETKGGVWFWDKPAYSGGDLHLFIVDVFSQLDKMMAEVDDLCYVIVGFAWQARHEVELDAFVSCEVCSFDGGEKVFVCQWFVNYSP